MASSSQWLAVMDAMIGTATETDAQTVLLFGRLDVASVAAVEHALGDLAARAGRRTVVRLDVGTCEEATECGAAVLVALGKALARAGSALLVVNARPRVAHLLAIAGVAVRARPPRPSGPPIAWA